MKGRYPLWSGLLLMVPPTEVLAQSALFDNSVVHEVRLEFAEPDWRQRMDALYVLGTDRLIGDLTIDGVSYSDVGVRFKGYSSYSPDQVKNPFNIELDHVVDGQDHQGFGKLKLSNVTSDPSFLRETLAYEVARNYMPASRTCFVNVYVNDTLQGLYVNVEDLDKDFLRRSFGSAGNPFFKGNPAVVSLFGENSNLSTNPGTDPSDYYSYYELESDQGWDDLLELIDVLNNDPAQVEHLLNVDRTLWMHAFNYALINFDSYVGYAQNYYLYRDDNGQWNPILWDLNMAFASFRLTDASLYWNGFNIPQAITMDPLMHHNSVSVFPRPLLRNLFSTPMYRRMYIAHLRTIIQERFANGWYRDRAEEYRSLIDASVVADTNKFFSDADFVANLDGTVNAITSYPGIGELMDQRVAFLTTYPGFTGQPVIGPPVHAPSDVIIGQDMTIQVGITGADTAFLAVRSGEFGAFTRWPLHDDGTHGDAFAGDGIHTCTFTTTSADIQYYIYAENASAGAFSPERAAHDVHRFLARLSLGALVINEVMADNGGQVLNEAGEAADWIELYNPTEADVRTDGLHLSDDTVDPLKWPLPATMVAAHGYLLLWADERTDLGDLHCDFRLATTGEELTLAYDSGYVMDRVRFSAQYPIYSTARYPNGSGPFQELVPTPMATNRITMEDGLDRAVVLYPNPATTEVNAVVRLAAPFTLQVLRSDGRAVSAAVERTTNELVRIGTQGLSAGHYVLSITNAESTIHLPFILVP